MAIMKATELQCNSYDGVNRIKNIKKYAREVELDKKYHNNRPVRNGIIKCPFYNLTVNGKNIEVYSTRTANGIHSFSYINVCERNDSFSLNVEISALSGSSVLKNSLPKTVVLPIKENIIPVVQKGKVNAVINKIGSFTFVFNDEHHEPLTLFVKYSENVEELFGNYEVEYVCPGDYVSATDRCKTQFTESKRVYYFKKGRYKIDNITLPSDSVLYLENGAYLEVLPSIYNDKNYALFVHDATNVKIAGRGIIDFSSCCGGETYSKTLKQNKNGLMIRDSENVTFSGITVINCCSWTLNFVDSANVKVEDVLIFGYRVFSDGVMLSDCVNGIVEGCFVRTGDDAFEVKSVGVKRFTDNVLFRNNAAWTDKAQAYGSIYECNHGTKNVRFEDCSVGFALATWSDHVSCCVIQMGDLPNRTVEDICFKNIEIFKTNNASALNLHIGGSGSFAFGYGNIDNIYFENIDIKNNSGAVLRLRTCDDKNCKIGKVFLNNIVSNGTKLTRENLLKNNFYIDKVVGGYDLDNLDIK